MHIAPLEEIHNNDISYEEAPYPSDYIEQIVWQEKAFNSLIID